MLEEVTEEFRKAADMTDDELVAIIDRAKLTVVGNAANEN